jgi:hypothetical protein
MEEEAVLFTIPDIQPRTAPVRSKLRARIKSQKIRY